MPVSGSPTVSRLQLGRELRRLRERAQVTRDAAAAELECDLSKISRLENGGRTLQPVELRALLRLYEATEEETARLSELGKAARRRAAIRVVDWARSFFALESEAAEIKSYQSELVPGLLQVPEYTRAVARAFNPTGDRAEVEHIVAVRQERQARLLGKEAPQLWVVINEAVIRRPVGGVEVMHSQLTRLRELAELPSISLQIMPFSAGAHAAMLGSFVILRLGELPEAKVVYLEDSYGADYVERPAQVDRYAVLFDRLCSTALDESGTRRMIEEAVGDRGWAS